MHSAYFLTIVWQTDSGEHHTTMDWGKTMANNMRCRLGLCAAWHGIRADLGILVAVPCLTRRFWGKQIHGPVRRMLGHVPGISPPYPRDAYSSSIQAGFFPSLAFIITTWYKRYEVQKRLAIFYLSSIVITSFASIFGTFPFSKSTKHVYLIWQIQLMVSPN